MQVHHVVAMQTFMCPHVLSANTVQEAYPLVFTEDFVANMLLADYNLLNERSTLFSAEFVSAKTLPAFTWILLVVTRPRRASAPAFAFWFFFRTASWFGRFSFGGAAPRSFAFGGSSFFGRRFGGSRCLRFAFGSSFFGRRFGGSRCLRFAFGSSFFGRRFGGSRCLRFAFGSRFFGGRFGGSRCLRFGGRSFLTLFGSRRFRVVGNNFANPDPTATVGVGVYIYNNCLARVRVLAPHSGARGRAVP